MHAASLNETEAVSAMAAAAARAEKSVAEEREATASATATDIASKTTTLRARVGLTDGDVQVQRESKLARLVRSLRCAYTADQSRNPALIKGI